MTLQRVGLIAIAGLSTHTAHAHADACAHACAHAHAHVHAHADACGRTRTYVRARTPHPRVVGRSAGDVAGRRASRAHGASDCPA